LRARIFTWTTPGERAIERELGVRGGSHGATRLT